MRVTFHDDGATFLRDAGDLLASDPLRFSVVASVAAQDAAASDRPHWFATVADDGGDPVGVAMRTHPDPPHAGFVAAMPPDALRALRDALAARGERVTAWNGDLDAARVLCEAVADGAPVDVAMHTRLFEATRVVWPAQPAGELRPATDADHALVADWLAGFHHDMEVQGGRAPDPDWTPGPRVVAQAIADETLWLWQVDGTPVHLTGVRPPVFGAARIGPVYTPDEHRGHGYAAWVVAVLTQRLLDAGTRACLYTDQANPVSNKVYERIGYERVRDEGNLVVRTP